MNKKIKKSLSVLLAVIITALSASVVFAAQVGFDGQGTQAEPYLIKTAEDLFALSDAVAAGESFSGVYFKLAGDIDIGEDILTPIGTPSTPFKGIFDGDGKMLTGVSVTAENAAVFAYLKDARICNVTVKDIYFDGDVRAAAVATDAVNTVFENCVAVGAAAYAMEDSCGAIVAVAENCVIGDCVNEYDIVSYEECAGGIVGRGRADISGCENSGAVSSMARVGGIAGQNKGKIVACKNSGEINVNDSYAGGIVGFAEGEISRCNNSGEVKGIGLQYGKIGGIVGYAKKAALSECSNFGKVTANDPCCAGIVAYADNSSVSDCMNAGAVSSSGSYVGGIFGWLGNISASKVRNCYNSADIKGPSGSFAGIGAVVVGGEVASCITAGKDMPAVGSATKATVTGCKSVNASALASEETFEGFDFDNTWEINGYHSYAYPVLSNINYHDLSLLRVVAPSCTTDGYSEYFCSICKASYDYDFVDMLGHDFVVVSEAKVTCTTDGYADYKCSRCTVTKSDEYKAPGHIDANNDLRCDNCNQLMVDLKPDAGKNIFQKIADFFGRIIEWFRGLFNKNK